MGASAGRALIAEGDRLVAEALSAHLRGDGFQVLEAASGLEAGADDYVVRPVSLPQLSARMRAQLRRARGFAVEEMVLRAGELELDLDARRCTTAGRPVELTRREFDLLGALLRYPCRMHTREQLLKLVWGTDTISPKTIDVHGPPCAASSAPRSASPPCADSAT